LALGHEFSKLSRSASSGRRTFGPSEVGGVGENAGRLHQRGSSTGRSLSLFAGSAPEKEVRGYLLGLRVHGGIQFLYRRMLDRDLDASWTLRVRRVARYY
jgi:hypothetical protein